MVAAAHDRETHALIKGVDRAPRLECAGLRKPRTVPSIYIGPKAPEAGIGWIPTDPERKFEFMFRLYGPKPEFFEEDVDAA